MLQLSPKGRGPTFGGDRKWLHASIVLGTVALRVLRACKDGSLSLSIDILSTPDADLFVEVHSSPT